MPLLTYFPNLAGKVAGIGQISIILAFNGSAVIGR
jgi:hypothetical protein